MKIGMVGLGKMGANMTERLLKAGHEVVAFDLSAEARDAVAAKGAEPATSLEDLATKLSAPRAVWVMVPSGAPTDSTIAELAGHFESGDVIVDGGNSNYKEAAPTAAQLAEKGIGFVDAGTSGGVWGLTEGYCLMVGGTDEAVAVVRAGPQDAGAGRGLLPRRAGRRRPLRQDGPQRHRVRPDAGLRRGVRAHEGSRRVLARPARDRVDLALRLGRPQLAARADRAGHPPGRRAGEDRAGHRRLRRGPVDVARGDRPGRARPR